MVAGIAALSPSATRRAKAANRPLCVPRIGARSHNGEELR
jgi:hypothetical protein